MTERKQLQLPFGRFRSIEANADVNPKVKAQTVDLKAAGNLGTKWANFDCHCHHDFTVGFLS